MKYAMFLLFVGQLIVQSLTLPYAVKIDNQYGMPQMILWLSLVNFGLGALALAALKTHWEDSSKSVTRHFFETWLYTGLISGLSTFFVAWLTFAQAYSVAIFIGSDTIIAGIFTAALVSASAGGFFNGFWGSLVSLVKACEG